MKRSLAIVAMAVLLVLGVAAYATAVSDSVDVTARAKPKIVLTLDRNTLDFGEVDPGSPVTTGTPVNVEVRSNQPFDLTKNIDNSVGAANMNLSTSFTDVSGYAAGTASWDDTYTVDVPWTADPATLLTATVTYTAIQP